MKDKEILITKEGLEKHKEELRKLKEEDMPVIIQHLQEARALGDLSENADYDAVRSEQGRVEKRIRELEQIIENAQIINSDDIKTDSVKIGLTVTVERLDNKAVKTYKIVGTTEADPLKEGIPHISNECAIGKALMGHKIGDVCTVNAKVAYSVKINKIELQ